MPKLSGLTSKINEYLVLPLQLPLVHAALPAIHYLYLCRHQPKLPTSDDARSLFIVNVPIDSTEGHFRGLFSSLGGGRVEKVVFEGEEKKQAVTVPHAGVDSRKRKRIDESTGERGVELKTWDRDLRRSGATAVVIFVDKNSSEMSLRAVARLTKSKKTADKEDTIVWGVGIGDGNKVPVLGISRYLTHHNLRFPSKSRLQQSVDTFMSTFAEQEAKNLRERARRRQPDEDGFITVARGGRVAPARQEEAAEKRKGNIEHKDFYRFQLREGKKQRHQQLLAKFEQDKKKVAERKEMRKFRPL